MNRRRRRYIAHCEAVAREKNAIFQPLIQYPHRFGDAADVQSGKATRLRDNTLAVQLSGERQGVLAWVVAGAVKWYASGLQVPASVRKNAEVYQTDHDRVGQFLDDECELDPRGWCANSELYGNYRQWCDGSGLKPLGKTRLLNELQWRIPGFEKRKKDFMLGGIRTSAKGIFGIKGRVLQSVVAKSAAVGSLDTAVEAIKLAGKENEKKARGLLSGEPR